jgi:hypothetical protein
MLGMVRKALWTGAHGNSLNDSPVPDQFPVRRKTQRFWSFRPRGATIARGACLRGRSDAAAAAAPTSAGLGRIL